MQTQFGSVSEFLNFKILQVHLHLSLIFIGSKAANSVADTFDLPKTLVGATQLRSLPKFHNFRGCNPVANTPEVKLSKSASLLQSLLKLNKSWINLLRLQCY